MNPFDFAAKYRVAALLFALWACYEVHFVIAQVFGNLAGITASVVSALGIVFALPAIAAGMLRWRRGDKFTSGGEEEK